MMYALRFALVGLAVAMAPAAMACTVDQSGPMPVCSLPERMAHERVLVIVGDGAVSTNLISPAPPGQYQRETTVKFAEIDLAPGIGPVHVVLSHYHPLVFRFTGDVKQITRVTALGAAGLSPLHFGIIGVPRDRVSVVPIIGRDERRYSTCAAPPKACIAEQFFDLAEKNPKLWIENLFSGQFLKSDARTTPDSVIMLNHGDWKPIRIGPDLQPIGRPELKARSQADSAALSKRLKSMTELEIYRELKPATTRLDNAEVYTALPGGFHQRDDLPSWEGLAALEADGTVVGAGTPAFDAVYAIWADEISASLRNPLDPDFQLAPKIDYVITKAVRIPAGLRAFGYEKKLTFLVAPGVQMPKAALDQGSWCLLFADHRQADQKERACELNRFSKIDAATDAAFTAANELETLQNYGATIKSSPTLTCRMISIPDDAKLIAVSTYAGVSAKNPNELHVIGCSGSACTRGRVSVEVKTKGKVFLVLDSFSQVDWTLMAGSGTELVGAATLAHSPMVITGLAKGAVAHHITRSPVNHGACNVATGVRGVHFGGPGAMLLSEAMTQLAGRPLDRFVNTSLLSLAGVDHIPSQQGFYKVTRQPMSGVEAYSRIVID
jgi:hypothetical protein